MPLHPGGTIGCIAPCSPGEVHRVIRSGHVAGDHSDVQKVDGHSAPPLQGVQRFGSDGAHHVVSNGQLFLKAFGGGEHGAIAHARFASTP